jgi:hypothetical protein
MRIDNPSLPTQGGDMVPMLLSSTRVTTPVSRVQLSLPTGFTFFIIFIRDLRMDVDDNGINLRFTLNGVPQSGASDYAWAGFRNGTGGVINVQDSADTEITLVGGATVIGNDPGQGFNSIVYFLNPENGELIERPHVNAMSSWVSGAATDNLNNSEISGRAAFNGVVDGVSIGTNTVNMVSGFFELYGVR